MDIAKFTAPTGQLLKIIDPKPDWAFVPHSLPTDWQFPAKLWPLLMEARTQLARLDGIGQSLPNPELLLMPLQSREAMRSSSLEGTFATPEELFLFEMHPREPKSETDPANAWKEVSNYSKSLRHGMTLLRTLPFCLRMMRELHNALLSGVRGRDKAPGEFRNRQVHIGSDMRFVPTPPQHLSECLNRLEGNLNIKNPPYDPLVWCYLLHYQFEAIHPFLDGNGRVGRVLLSLMIHRLCDLKMPWLYMSSYFEKYKDEYIDNLFAVSAQGAWETWITFCLNGTVSQATDAISRCSKLKNLKEKYHNESGNAGPRAHAIIERLFTTPVLDVRDVVSAHDVTYPTAKNDIEKLVELGILAELSDTRPKSYYAKAIFDVAYSEN